MEKIEEILQLEDIGKKIEYLKKGRRTELPDKDSLYSDWNPNLHEIMVDKIKYPQIEITIEPSQEEYDESTGKEHTIPAKKKKVDPNRIVLPLEQDIVNIHTAFTVGTELSMECAPDKSEKGIFEAVKQVLKKNKIKYQNRRIVRSWLSEKDIAEYWYVTKDDGFWARLKSKISDIFGVSTPQYKLKSVLWSPFLGDNLYPFFDESGDMTAFSREYSKRDLDGHEVSCFMTLDNRMVIYGRWTRIGDWFPISDMVLKNFL